MRTPNIEIPPFFGGIVAGLALAGVALLTVEAVRRVRARSSPVVDDGVLVIDGVRPLAAPEIQMHEANSIPQRVASDVADPAPMSQRW